MHAYQCAVTIAAPSSCLLLKREQPHAEYPIADTGVALGSRCRKSYRAAVAAHNKRVRHCDLHDLIPCRIRGHIGWSRTVLRLVGHASTPTCRLATSRSASLRSPHANAPGTVPRAASAPPTQQITVSSGQ